MAPPLATVGILSVGDMGMSIAKLLIANHYRVVTNLEGRSAETRTRVELAEVESVPSDVALVTESDYILSVVPPRDATTIAKRIVAAIGALSSAKAKPLYYLDLNAIAPHTAREIAALFKSTDVRFIDGGIIGGPPSPKAKLAETVAIKEIPSSHRDWIRPSIPLSGPVKLPDAKLQDVLNGKHISDVIGTASGLKCCFASTTKGFSAVAIQAFTTASALGVLSELQHEMATRVPELYRATAMMTNAPPKAYRWVREMEEIALCHTEDGGFEGDGSGIFDAVGELYKNVAENELLGREKIGKRTRGQTVEDVAELVGEGLKKRRKKVE